MLSGFTSTRSRTRNSKLLTLHSANASYSVKCLETIVRELVHVNPDNTLTECCNPRKISVIFCLSRPPRTYISMDSRTPRSLAQDYKLTPLNQSKVGRKAPLVQVFLNKTINILLYIRPFYYTQIGYAKHLVVIKLKYRQYFHDFNIFFDYRKKTQCIVQDIT